ncbi:MAG: SdpI family protein [Candidatus Nanoarchaeia archaeon]|nr:SdpI family protein [Candidatus Nanoarchaeia archaeon]
MRKSEIVALVIILASFLVSFYFYPQMPENVASHWNIEGQVDGYMNRFWGTFMMPLVILGLFLLFAFIPKIDPLKKNIEDFRKEFDLFIIVFLIFMFSIHVQVILWNIGVKINPGITIPIGIGILFIFIGSLLEKAKRNWFIGIRTPWTLSSDNVWDKTHKLGAKVFRILGVLFIFTAFFPQQMFFTLMVFIFAGVFYLFIYSYIEYKKEKK